VILHCCQGVLNHTVLKTLKRDFAVWKGPDAHSRMYTKGEVLRACIRVPFSRSGTVVRFPLLICCYASGMEAERACSNVDAKASEAE
jgi:hypothetical protein